LAIDFGGNLWVANNRSNTMSVISPQGEQSRLSFLGRCFYRRGAYTSAGFVPLGLDREFLALSWRRIETGKKKSPGGLPFSSRPRRFSWGLSSTSMLVPSPLCGNDANLAFFGGISGTLFTLASYLSGRAAV
jgi:hypothetical protein